MELIDFILDGKINQLVNNIKQKILIFFEGIELSDVEKRSIEHIIDISEPYEISYIKTGDKDIEKRFNEFEYKTNAYYIPFDATKDIVSFIENNKDILTDFEVIKGDMDDVFLNVTGRELE